MKLAYLAFDDMITVPGGRRLGEDSIGDACESTFRAADGWDLRQTSEGVFTLRSECMLDAMTVGGHGYRYIPEPPEMRVVSVDGPSALTFDPPQPPITVREPTPAEHEARERASSKGKRR